MPVSVSEDEIARYSADTLLPTDPEFANQYAADVAFGRDVASRSSVLMVAICRNAMPWLPRTLKVVEETGAMFRDCSAFVYENDSIDGTKEVLANWADGSCRFVSLNSNGRPHLNTVTTPDRTHALAEYRAACQHWVRNYRDADFVIVFDSDPWGSWSVEGVATSIAHMERDKSWYGMASYSWAEMKTPEGPFAIHYDAFAARINHWNRRNQMWFHYWHPAVGGSPVEFRSAFGQLAVYRLSDYKAGTYSGDDCEHVCFHRSISRPGRRLGLNPSSRCVSFWVPSVIR